MKQNKKYTQIMNQLNCKPIVSVLLRLCGVMQRFLKLTKFYLGYAFYVIITVNERTNYLQAQQRGYDCTHSHDDSYVFYGSVKKYYFDKTKPPTKHYVTYKQYKRMHYPNVA